MPSERKIVFLAFTMMLLNLVDFMVVSPLAPYFESKLHISVSLIGSIVGIYALAAGTSSLIFSRFIDKIKRKNAILFALVGLAVTTALTACAWNEVSLLLFRCIAGIFGGPVATLANTIVADHVPAHRRGKAMGILLSSFSVSAAVAVPIAIVIATHTHWRFSFLCISLFLLLLILYIIIAVPNFQQSMTKEKLIVAKSLLKNYAVWIAYLCVGLSTGSIFLLVPNYANFFVMNGYLHINNLPIVYLLGGLSSIIAANISGHFTDKLGPVLVNTIGAILMILALSTGIVIPILPVFLFYIISLGSASVRMSSLMTQLSNVPSASQRGSFMSLQTSVRSFMMAIGAAASGLFLTKSADGHLQGMDHLAIIVIIVSLLIPLMMLYIAKYLRTRASIN